MSISSQPRKYVTVISIPSGRMTSTSPSAFEEGSVLDNEMKTGSNAPEYAGPTLNATSKNGYSSKTTKPGGRLSKNTLFKICLLLLILALLLPILILAALIYKNMGSKNESAPLARAALQGEPPKIPGEENTVPNAKNEEELKQQMEEIYKKEPWRRDPTNSWKQLGSSLSQSIDTTNDPCKDFYAYSCDQWKSRHPLDGKKEISYSSVAAQRVEDSIVQALVSVNPDDSTWPASVRWAKKFYDRCVSADKEELTKRRLSVIDFLSNAMSPSHAASTPDSEPSPALRRVKRAEGGNETSTADSSAHNSSEPVPAPPVPTSPLPEHPVPNSTVPESATSVSAISALPPAEFEHNVTVVTLFEHIEEYVNVTIPTDTFTAVSVPTEGISEGNETVPNEGSAVEEVTMLPVEGPVQATASSSDSDVNIWEFAGKLNKLGVSNLFTVLSVKSANDSVGRKVVVSPPILSLESRRQYLEQFLFSRESPKLEKLIGEKIKELKDTIPDDTAPVFPDDPSSTASKIVQFEQILAKASPEATIRPDDVPSIDKMETKTPATKTYSFSKLQSRWPSVDWEAFLGDEEEGEKTTNQSSAVQTFRLEQKNETGSFIITDPSYVDQLVGLLEDTDRKTIINYLKWRYLDSVAGYFNQSGLNKTCYNALMDGAPLALAHLVYKTNYSLTKEEKDSITYTPESLHFLFNRTVRAAKSVVEFSNQISNQSKKALIEDLDSRSIITDWPSLITNPQSLDKLYYNLDPATVDNATFMAASDALRSTVMEESSMDWKDNFPGAFTGIRVANEQLLLVQDPRILNEQMNTAAVSQFATLGWQMAWRLMKSVHNKAMKSKIDQCLINQYNQFCYESPINQCVDGASTMDNNFLDSVSLQVAYKAYDTWRSVTSSSGDSDAFPAYLVASNLGQFTMDQLFLLSYSTPFCSNEENDEIIEQLTSKKKAPNRDRMVGSVENLDGFYTAFKCKPTDKMHRDAKERCQL